MTTRLARLGVVVRASAAALALASGAADAQTWYTVEIIAFEEISDEGLYAERWPPDPGVASLDGAVELSVPLDAELAGDAPHAFRLLPPDQLELGGVWSALRRSAGYRPILHLAWHQPGFGRRSARPAHLTTRLGENPGSAIPILDGTLRLYRARYLHVEADLLYHRSGAAIATSGAAPIDRFRFQTSRRMRSGELHYLDHPLFGLIVRVTPYRLPGSTEPAPEEPPPSTDGEASPGESDDGETPGTGAAPATRTQ